MSRYVCAASVMGYIFLAGPPLDVYQVHLTMPSFSIGLQVLYYVPAFFAPNPNAAARSVSS